MADIMDSWFHKGIISEVSTDIGLNNLTADAALVDKVLIKATARTEGHLDDSCGTLGRVREMEDFRVPGR
jgi:hypothetical protein